MIIVPKSKPHNYYDYTGTPDKVVERKENLTKGSEVKFNIFSGWVDYPIYKELNELDSKDLTSYNKGGIIYIYQPNHTRSDKMGMRKFKLIGVTKLLQLKPTFGNLKFETILRPEFHQNLGLLSIWSQNRFKGKNNH